MNEIIFAAAGLIIALLVPARKHNKSHMSSGTVVTNCATMYTAVYQMIWGEKPKHHDGALCRGWSTTYILRYCDISLIKPVLSNADLNSL